MFDKLEQINERPKVFGQYTADALWADDHRSKKMLAYHLNEGIDVSSRNLDFIDRSSTWISERFDLGPDKSVCDFGCGPGLYTSRFAKSRARVTGLDFSKNSIQYAREQAAKANQFIAYTHTNYLEYEPSDRFDLITMIMCDFCALSPTQRAGLLAKFRDGLTDGGAILLDVYSLAAYAEREEVSLCEKNQLDHFWCEGDYYCFLNTFKYDQEHVILDKYSIFQQDGRAEEVYNWLQYFSPQSLTDELSAAGFCVRDILRDVAGNTFCEKHTQFAIVAEKT